MREKERRVRIKKKKKNESVCEKKNEQINFQCLNWRKERMEGIKEGGRKRID